MRFDIYTRTHQPVTILQLAANAAAYVFAFPWVSTTSTVSRPLHACVQIIVGHNPSAHAWQSGHYYSNPSNHMWRILAKAGIAPAGTKGAVADDAMPAGMGVGFLDVGCGFPGTDR